jgi:hypothetical protein
VSRRALRHRIEKTMPPLIVRVLWTGLVSGIVSGAAAAALGRLEHGRARPPLNAVSHIAWGGPPPADDGRGRRNLAMGAGVHVLAAVFWAAAFEPLFGSRARRSQAAAWSGAALTASAAYLTDYRLVPPRLRPGMEAFLSRTAVRGVYAALALGFVLAARRGGAGPARRRRRPGARPGDANDPGPAAAARIAARVY